MNVNKPYYLLEPIENTELVIDPRVSFLMNDVLKGFMKMELLEESQDFLTEMI